MVAKLQYALAEQSTELKDLKGTRDELMSKAKEAINELSVVQAELKRATDNVEKLREDVRKQQVTVDEQIGR